MTLAFEFATATRIVFGPGKVSEAASEAASLGLRALVVGGSRPGRLQPLLEKLRAARVGFTLFSVPGEPTLPVVSAGVARAGAEGCAAVIGCGGGSVLDAAKAIAALLTNPGDPLDYLEVVGRGNPLPHPPAPCICLPTTAGTGCEVTRNAVLIAPEQRVKVSLRSPMMLPRLAVVDPELTRSLPPSLTASTGLDALTQLVEPLLSVRSNPLTDGLCRDGIRRAARWLRAACADGDDMEARENMALASLFGGLALANAGLGAVHGLAAPLGGMFPVPHGIVCARLLPGALGVNLSALRSRAPGSPALARMDEVARLLTGDGRARAEDGIEWLERLVADLGLPRLGAFGLTREDLGAVASQGVRSSSMRGNPLPLEREELCAILESAL
jgi:alcohol dehydrogenase class IV